MAQSPNAPADCALCPRLARFRRQLAHRHPDWRNRPVPCFGGGRTARLLIVGLAPGLRGANRTGRPFTGDGAGKLLYRTLCEQGFARGTYGESAQDGLTLRDCMITNAVRCVPPENRPLAEEIRTCRRFLSARIAAMPRLRAVLALGRIAHDSALDTLNLRRRAYPFGHGRRHDIDEIEGRAGRLSLFDSYHCSQRNVSTKLLKAEDFARVFAAIRKFLAA